MADAPQNRFLENVISKANDLGAVFLIASAKLTHCPIIYCSDCFAEETGFTRSEVTRKDVYHSFLHGRKTPEASKMSFRNAVLQKRKTQVETILYDFSGEKKWYLVYLTPVCDSEKEVFLFLVMFYDISHIKPPLTDSPKKLWKRAVKKALNKTDFTAMRNQRRNAGRKKQCLESIAASQARMFVPEYGREKLQFPKYVIYHSHSFKQCWDVYILMLILFTAVYIPFLISFLEKSNFVLELVLDLMFIVDIVMTFFTTYIDDDGVLIVNLNKIKWNYLKGWFALHVVSSIPFSLLSLINDEPAGYSLIRVCKLFRLVRISRAGEKMKRFMQRGVITLAFWILLFSLCGHWLACVWYVIARRVDVRNNNSWLAKLAEMEGIETFPNGNNYPSLSYSYIAALYYVTSSLTTCGFGNIAPNTSAEMTFGVLTMICGCVMYAFIFGQVTNIISQMSTTSNEYLLQLNALRQFNTTYKIPKAVQKRAESFFTATWAVTKGSDEEKIMSNFPRDLQSDVCLHIHKDVFRSNVAFKHLSQNAQRSMARFFWTHRTAPGDKLIFYGELVDSIYFVSSGSFEVIHRNELVGLIGPGDSFGQRPVSMEAKSVCEVQANSFGIIHSISIAGLEQALAIFPQERDIFKYTIQLSYDITKKINIEPHKIDSQKEEEINEQKQMIPDDEKPEDACSPPITDVEQSLDESFYIESDNHLYLPDNFNHRTPSSEEELVVMSELRTELRKETDQMHRKMGVLEAQMRVVLKLLRKKNNRIDPEIGEKLDDIDGELTQVIAFQPSDTESENEV